MSEPCSTSLVFVRSTIACCQANHSQFYGKILQLHSEKLVTLFDYRTILQSGLHTVCKSEADSTPTKDAAPTVSGDAVRTRCRADIDRDVPHLSFSGKRDHAGAKEATYTMPRGGVLLHRESLHVEA